MTIIAWTLGAIGDLALVWLGWRYILEPKIRKIARQEIDRMTGMC